MSNFILENLLKNSRQLENKVEFDLTKSMMSNQRQINFTDNNVMNNIPIKPTSNEWETVEINGQTCLYKEFKFLSFKHMIYFIVECLKKAKKINHHPEITILEDVVTIKLTTHDMNDVSGLDVDMSNFIKDLYDDIDYMD